MSKGKTNVSKKTLEMALMALLSALIIIMTVCGIGYIPINPVLKLTFNVLPVAVGSVLMGWKMGLILGGVFGVSSFITCFGMDVVGGILLSANPFLCAVMCIVPRLLCGALPSLIYKAISIKDKKGFISVPVATMSAALINTLLFLTTMWVFFSAEFLTNESLIELVGSINNVIVLFVTFAGINALLEAAVCLVAGAAIVKALQSFMKKMK